MSADAGIIKAGTTNQLQMTKSGIMGTEQG